MSKQDFIKEYKFWKSLQGQKFPPKLTKLIKTNSEYIYIYIYIYIKMIQKVSYDFTKYQKYP